MILLLLLPLVGAFCVFESPTAMYWSSLSPQIVLDGCRAGCTNQSYPLVSFPEVEFIGTRAADCSQGPVVACGDPKLLGSSVRSLLRNPMYRSWEQVGLNSSEGWWTNSQESGILYVPQAFVGPHSTRMLGTGEIGDSLTPRRWLCACLN